VVRWFCETCGIVASVGSGLPPICRHNVGASPSPPPVVRMVELPEWHPLFADDAEVDSPESL
jgi:hypothetical protein